MQLVNLCIQESARVLESSGDVLNYSFAPVQSGHSGFLQGRG